MDPLLARDVVAATGGTMLQGSPDEVFPLLTTDTRSLAPGALFLALRGDRFDGHDFVGRALEGGAKGFVVAADRADALASMPDDVVAIAVGDTLHALGRVANFRRRLHGVPLVAITGSNGKTSTKELIAALLMSQGDVLKTPENHNNQVGVPLTLLELTARHRYAVIELGTSEPGEIAKLAAIAEPDVGVITNVAPAHTEGLGDVEGVAVEKGSLFEALPARGAAVVNLDDPQCVAQAGRSKARRVTFGEAEAADVRIEEYRFGSRTPCVSGVATFEGESFGFDTHLVGFHQVRNAAAALAAAHCLGLSPRQHASKLVEAAPQPHRMQYVEVAGLRVLDDAYNANPQSTHKALETLQGCRDLEGGRALAVVGDMKELGDLSERAHIEVGRMVGELGLDGLITVGDAMGAAAEVARQAGVASVTAVEDADEALTWVRRFAEAGDWVLVKGSRSMRLERIVDALRSDRRS